jgi:hypothetical protein
MWDDVRRFTDWSATSDRTAMQCSAVQCSAAQCSAVQCTVLHCIALNWTELHCKTSEILQIENIWKIHFLLQFSAVQFSAVQCSAVQCLQWSAVLAVQCSAVQCSACSGVQCSSKSSFCGMHLVWSLRIFLHCPYHSVQCAVFSVL